MRIKKALIPAAGLGTRLLPATKVVPKELLPIVHRPALEYIADELVESGIEEVILVLHPDKESISGHFSKGGNVEDTLAERGQLGRLETLHRILGNIKFTVAYQEQPLGLGHAVWCGKEAIGDEPFAVVLPDDLVRSSKPCLRQMMEAYEKHPGSYVAVEEVPEDRVHLYGIVHGTFEAIGRSFGVDHVVEKPAREQAPSRHAIIGRYILDPSIFSILEKISKGSLGELQLTDGLQVFAQAGSLRAFPFEGIRHDVGQPLGFVQANLIYAMDDPTLAKPLAGFMQNLLENLSQKKG